jgi:hypothetical protein
VKIYSSRFQSFIPDIAGDPVDCAGVSRPALRDATHRSVAGAKDRSFQPYRVQFFSQPLLIWFKALRAFFGGQLPCSVGRRLPTIAMRLLIGSNRTPFEQVLPAKL